MATGKSPNRRTKRLIWLAALIVLAAGLLITSWAISQTDPRQEALALACKFLGRSPEEVQVVRGVEQLDAKPPPDSVVAVGLGVDKERLAPVGGQWLSSEDLVTKGQKVQVGPTAGAGPSAAPEACWVIFNASGTALQSVLWLDRRRQAGTPCDAAAATAIAQDLGKRLLGDWPPGLKLQRCKLLPMGMFDVDWLELEGPEVATGLHLAVSVSAKNSLVESWVLVVPARRHTQDEVRVTRADAEARALESAATRGTTGGALCTQGALLVLSYGPPANDGPVWFIDVAAAGPEGTARPVATIIIDAVTGKDVPPGRRGQGGASSGAAPGPSAP